MTAVAIRSGKVLGGERAETATTLDDALYAPISMQGETSGWGKLYSQDEIRIVEPDVYEKTDRWRHAYRPTVFISHMSPHVEGERTFPAGSPGGVYRLVFVRQNVFASTEKVDCLDAFRVGNADVKLREMDTITSAQRPIGFLHSVVFEFSRGADREDVVDMASRIVKVVEEVAKDADISVDEDDGDLDFDLRLPNGLLVMANLFRDGTIDASIYDDSQGPPVSTVRRMRRATTSEEEFISLFKVDADASTS